MKPLLLFTAIFCMADSNAQNHLQRQYIAKHKDLAIAEMRRTGVPASIKLAQAMLESVSGTSELATNANNHFGIKCGDDWQGSTYHKHNDLLNVKCYRKYTSTNEGFKGHSDFLRQRKHYASLFKLDPLDYKGWAHGLKKAGYATNPGYANELISWIDLLGLSSYDSLALNIKKQSAFPTAGLDKPVTKTDLQTQKMKDEISTMKSQTPAIPPTAPEVKQRPPVTDKTPPIETKAKFDARKVFIKNKTKYILVPNGMDMGSLAMLHGSTIAKLEKYNDLDAGQVLVEGAICFIEPKKMKNKEANEVHIVKEGETMHNISQQYGIRLESLLWMNRLVGGEEPIKGERIHLKTKASNAPKVYRDDIFESNMENTPTIESKPIEPSEANAFKETKPAETTAKPEKPSPRTEGQDLPIVEIPPVLKPEKSQPRKPSHYIVQAGDTLFGIARKLGVPVALLKKVNNIDGGELRVGQELKVP